MPHGKQKKNENMSEENNETTYNFADCPSSVLNMHLHHNHCSMYIRYFEAQCLLNLVRVKLKTGPAYIKYSVLLRHVYWQCVVKTKYDRYPLSWFCRNLFQIYQQIRPHLREQSTIHFRLHNWNNSLAL